MVEWEVVKVTFDNADDGPLMVFHYDQEVGRVVVDKFGRRVAKGMVEILGLSDDDGDEGYVAIYLAVPLGATVCGGLNTPEKMV